MTDPFTSATETTPKVDASEVKRDRYGRYMLPRLSDASGKHQPWTRATTFCKSVADTYGLMQWSNRMVAKGVAMRTDLYALAAATPVEDRNTLNRLAEDAKTAAGASSAASLGTAMHSFTEAVDRGENPDVPVQYKNDVEAYKKLVKGYGLHIPAWGIERIITVEKYGIAGTFDRIAQFTEDVAIDGVQFQKDDWVIVDVKTGRDLTYGFAEISIQLALYAHADAMWNGSEGEYEDMPEVRQDVALVVHLPVGKGEASLYALDIEQGWEAAELCANVREWRKKKGLAHRGKTFRNGPPTWEDRINDATSRQDLSQIWKEASAAGQWTSALEKLGKDRLKNLA